MDEEARTIRSIRIWRDDGDALKVVGAVNACAQLKEQRWPQRRRRRAAATPAAAWRAQELRQWHVTDAHMHLLARWVARAAPRTSGAALVGTLEDEDAAPAR